MKSLVGAEEELIVIQVIHSEFDVEAMQLIVIWRIGLERGAHILCFFCFCEEDNVLS